MKIIVPDVPYQIACSDRRELLCFKLLDVMKDQKHKLHDLLPLKHETIYSLRHKKSTLYQSATQIVTKMVLCHGVYLIASEIVPQSIVC